MPSPHARRQQQRRREQERQRRTRLDAPPPSAAATRSPRAVQPVPAELRRRAAKECGWCLGTFTPKSHGPVPKWCSASCRQRAWEQRRAAASGLSAIEVVERVVEVAAPVQAPPKPRNQEWHAPLRELTRQIRQGLVYDRHLIGIADEVRQVYLALRARGTWGDSAVPTSPQTGGTRQQPRW